MQNRTQVIANCELMRQILTDFDTLDAEISQQLEETQIIAELVKSAVNANATTVQSQEAYLKQYESLTKRYEAATAKLDELKKERTLRSQQDKAIALFIRTLKKQPKVLNDWDDTIWTVMVEKAIVCKNRKITFVFTMGQKFAPKHNILNTNHTVAESMVSPPW